MSEIKLCPICGNKVKKSSRTYCSVECQHKSMQIKLPDNVNTKCLNCNTLLSHRQMWSKQKFCSKSCRNSYVHDRKFANIIMYNCCICDKPLSAEQCKAHVKTCSPLCAYKLRCSLYGEKSKANADKMVQYAKVNRLRHDKDYIKQRSDYMKMQWSNDVFRQNVINRMITDNPTHKVGVVDKINQTKQSNSNLHKWLGVRGGNGKITKHEQLLYDFLINLGFQYNLAIVTTTIRKLYPEEHYGFNYKPDYTNNKLKFCIEIDGKTHKSFENKKLDMKKEKCLSLLGYQMIRYTNEQIENNIDWVKLDILNKLEELKNG